MLTDLQTSLLSPTELTVTLSQINN